MVELGYGVDKPGAMAHHTLRVRKTSTYYSLSDFAHREPQMIMKPAGAKVAVKASGTGTRAKPLTISWTETLGAAPIDPNLIGNDELSSKFTSLGNNEAVDGNFHLDAPLLQLVQRFGERIIPISEEDTRVFLPVSSVGEGKPHLPELLLVSKVDLAQEQKVTRQDAGGNQITEIYQLYLAITDQPDGNSWGVERLVAGGDSDGCFNLVKDVDYRIYKLAPRFMKMIATSQQHKLQIIWQKLDAIQSTLDSAAFDGVARVFPSEKTLDRVFLGPFTPKAMAVARYDPLRKGFLGTWRDRTLFFGDAASGARAEVAIEDDQLVFSASQSVQIVGNYATPQSVFLVKYLDEGQVVYDVHPREA